MQSDCGAGAQPFAESRLGTGSGSVGPLGGDVDVDVVPAEAENGVPPGWGEGVPLGAAFSPPRHMAHFHVR